MAITRALGLGVLIIVLKLLAPQVLSEGEAVAVAFLHGALVSTSVATDLAASAADAQISNEPFDLPRVPATRPD